MSVDWPESVMAERLAAQRAWLEHQRWLADARQKLAEVDPPPVLINPPPEQGES